MKKIVTIVFLLLFACVLTALFKEKTYILGGEGNYFLNPSIVAGDYFSTWHQGINGVGGRNPLLNFYPVLFFLSIIEKTVGMQLGTNIFLLLFFFVCFGLVFYISKIISKSTGTALLVSLFYVVNPYFITQSGTMMYWNIAPLVFFPLVFISLYKNHYNIFRSLFFFGLACFIFSFSFANIPYLGVFMIYLPVSFILESAVLDKKIYLPKIIIRYIFHLLVFILVSLWWLLPLISAQFYGNKSIYQKNFAISWAQTSSEEDIVLQRTITLRSLNSPKPGNFLSNFYYNPVISAVSFIPLIAVLTYLVRKKANKKISYGIFFFLLAIMLNKGINEPFQKVYLFALEKIPFFIIFKTPLEKFGVFVLFIFTYLLSVALSEKSSKIEKWLLLIYVSIFSVVIFNKNIIPDYNIQNGNIVTRKFVLKPEYKSAIDILNKDGDYRILSLPGSVNYQVTMQNRDNKYYRGMDPILYAINKPFIAAYSGDLFSPIYKNIANKNIGKYLSIYSIKKVMLNSDIFPAFGFVEKDNLATISANLDKTMTLWNDGSITLYENPYFVPHIFIPSSVIELVDATPSGIAKLALQDSYKVGSVFVDRNQKFPNDLLSISFLAKINFQKITPDKYAVSISGMDKKTPIVFNESFDNGWQLITTNGKVIAQDTHKMVNGYANSWIIDPKIICAKELASCTLDPDGTNSISFSIEYRPKNLFYLGIWTSGASLVGLFVICIYLDRKQRNEK